MKTETFKVTAGMPESSLRTKIEIALAEYSLEKDGKDNSYNKAIATLSAVLGAMIGCAKDVERAAALAITNMGKSIADMNGDDKSTTDFREAAEENLALLRKHLQEHTNARN